MFENLSERLGSVFDRLTKQGALSAGGPAGVYTVGQAGEIASAETAADALRLKKFYAAQNAGEVARSDFSADAGMGTMLRLGGSDRR